MMIQSVCCELLVLIYNLWLPAYSGIALDNCLKKIK